MPTTQLTRRQFMMGCSAAIAAMAGARITQVAFADPLAPGAYNDETLVVVFLRGAWDALNVVPPIAGADRGYYETARTSLKVPTSGTGAALPLNAQFGLHPSMTPLLNFYQAGKLAIVHACGLNYDTRSHFDAQNFIELGTPGQKNTPNGWITRHLQSATNLPTGIVLPALSAGSSQPTSLLSYADDVAMTSPTSFAFAGNYKYKELQRTSLRNMYNGDTMWLHQAGKHTLDVVGAVEAAAPGTYTPANGAIYPTGSFGDNLKVIAQIMKFNLGRRVATIDLGGWDTHEYQGVTPGQYMPNLLDTLSRGLAAFYTDLDGCGAQNYASRFTIAVLSEFGRRLRQNANGGTDHGHGSVVLVMGGAVVGGQIYGTWPGLQTDQLYDRADLAVTTDYRQVLSEILVRRLENNNLSTICPGYTGYQPMGIVRDRTPVPPPASYTNKIFLPLVNNGATSCP